MAGRYLAGEFGTLSETNPYLSSLAFAGDRWQAKEKISKNLRKGTIIVSNRYALSNMSHQTAKLPRSKRGAFLRFLEELEYFTYKIPKEDLNIFLDVPPKIGQRLVDKKEERKYTKGKKRDIHEEDLEYQIECLGMYRFLARKYPKAIKIINCCDSNGKLKSVDEVHGMIWQVVRRIL